MTRSTWVGVWIGALAVGLLWLIVGGVLPALGADEDDQGPEAVVEAFLESVRLGDVDTMTALVTEERRGQVEADRALLIRLARSPDSIRTSLPVLSVERADEASGSSADASGRAVSTTDGAAASQETAFRFEVLSGRTTIADGRATVVAQLARGDGEVLRAFTLVAVEGAGWRIDGWENVSDGPSSASDVAGRGSESGSRSGNGSGGSS